VVDLRHRRRSHFLAAQTERLVVAAAALDTRAAAEVIVQVGGKYGHGGVFSLCYGLADIVQQLVFPASDRGDGTLTGEMIAIETSFEPTCVDAAAALWAYRFVAAYINGDDQTSTALFFGGLHDKRQMLTNVGALVALAGEVVRKSEGA
jgi:hypothetical protein